MSARRVALGLAGGFAVLMPLVLLVPRGGSTGAEVVAPPPVPLAAPAALPDAALVMAQDEEALVGDLTLQRVEEMGIRLLKISRIHILVTRIEDHSHSSAPFFQA